MIRPHVFFSVSADTYDILITDMHLDPPWRGFSFLPMWTLCSWQKTWRPEHVSSGSSAVTQSTVASTKLAEWSTCGTTCSVYSYSTRKKKKPCNLRVDVTGTGARAFGRGLTLKSDQNYISVQSHCTTLCTASRFLQGKCHPTKHINNSMHQVSFNNNALPIRCDYDWDRNAQLWFVASDQYGVCDSPSNAGLENIQILLRNRRTLHPKTNPTLEKLGWKWARSRART